MRIHKIKSDNIFFTSDLHFNHFNIIKFCGRPCTNIEEMHEMLIKRWNEKVPKDGVTYILGDVSWKGADETKCLLDQLNGKKILIIGNHDYTSVIDQCFDEAYDMLFLQVTDTETGYVTSIHMSHYPLIEWDKMRYGSIHLHGHCHGTMDITDKHNSKRMDVGVDSNNWTPLSFNDVKTILNNKINK